DIEYPPSSFYFWKNKKATVDLIMFGSPLPSHGHYEFANLVLDVAELFAVKRIYAVGGVPANVAHMEIPRLFGVVNSSRLKKYLKPYDVELNLDYHGPTSMNGLLLGLAKHRGIDGMCLYGRVPSYIGGIPNPGVSESILRVLAQMLSIELDFTEIESEARLASKQIDEIVSYIREQSPELDRHIGKLEMSTTFEHGEEGRKDFFKELEEFLKKRQDGQGSG
ncbi:MAG: PAC2 family protein, partial [Chloroflexi bacterium]|nr:PAC2 family protein [Chloroflexota bacterium]